MSDKIYIKGLSKALFEANAKIHELEHRLARIAEICEQRGARLKNPTPRDIYLIAKGETDEP